MAEKLFLCSILLLLGATDRVIGDILGNVMGCSSDSASSGCNCSYTKRYTKGLNISCVDSSNNCTWYHRLNNSLERIEEKFRTSDKKRIELLGYYDNDSYGYFVAINSSGVSCYYLVAPPLNANLTNCNNCSGIKINGTRRNNNDIICTRRGDNMIVQGEVPQIFNISSFVVRIGTQNVENCIQEGEVNELSNICSTLTASDIGVYCVHVSFQLSMYSNPEWRSNNVTVMFQSLISFTQSVYIANESTGLQPVLNLNNPSPVDIMIQVFTTDITALGGGNMDYGSEPYNVTLPSGNTTVSFEVKINYDNTLEGNETFRITINATSLPACVNRGNPYEATVTIVDDDVGSVRFENGIYNVSENSTAQIVLILSKPSSNEVTVKVLYTGITATGGDGESVDYHAGPYDIKFPVEVTRFPLNVTIVNDNILENNETFNVTINSSSLPSNVRVGDPGQATVIIRDDDVATVKFKKKEYCFMAGDYNVQPTLILNSTSSTNVTIEVSRTDLGEGADSNSYNVTFVAGDASAQFNVSIYGGSEGNRTMEFDLNINSSSLPYNVAVGNPGKAKVTMKSHCGTNGAVGIYTGVTISGVIWGIIVLGAILGEH